MHASETPPSFFFAISAPAQKRGIGFRCRPTTLSAISRIVDGVGGRLNVPSHLTLPGASSGYSISALQHAPVELGSSTRGKFGVNLRRIWGQNNPLVGGIFRPSYITANSLRTVISPKKVLERWVNHRSFREINLVL